LTQRIGATVRVDFEDVGRRYGEFDALVDLNLGVDEGEFVVLVGPSGSGKTTALRILAGLDQATSGRVLIGGRVVNDVAPAERDVAMVFQSYALYPHMTVRQNLAYGLKRRGVDKAEIATRVTETAALLELEGLLDRRPRQLSGGQQQRVAVCRALVRRPGVLLMDEPLSNLDARLRTHARGEIRAVHASVGATTVYVTHDQVEAMTMGDRIAVMHEGRVAQFATPDEIYARPATRFVAGFIGSPAMSFLAVDAAIGDGGVRLRSGEIDATVPAPAELAGHGAVVLGVRPEHVRPWGGDAVSSGLLGPVSGEVGSVEHLGRESFMEIRLASGDVVTSQIATTDRPRLGDTVAVGFEAGHVHVFDATTGQAIGRSADWTGRAGSAGSAGSEARPS